MADRGRSSHLVAPCTLRRCPEMTTPRGLGGLWPRYPPGSGPGQALFDIGALDLAAGELLRFLDDASQRVPVVWISRQRFGMQDELAVWHAGVGGDDRDLDAKFAGSLRLAFADALDPRLRKGSSRGRGRNRASSRAGCAGRASPNDGALALA